MDLYFICQYKKLHIRLDVRFESIPSLPIKLFIIVKKKIVKTIKLEQVE